MGVQVDGALVRRAQAGDADARDALATACRRPAYLLALQLTGNADDALDVAQDALLRFFEALGRYDGERALGPWLLTIVRNRARDLWRRRAARPGEGADGDGLAAELVDAAPDPEQALAARERARRVWRAVGALAPDHREVLVLRDYHDLSYAEIAEVLAIPAGTVMSRLHAARRAFARRVGDTGLGDD